MRQQVEREAQIKLHFDTMEKERAAGMAGVLASLQRMGDVVGELGGIRDAVRGMEASLKADQQQLLELRGEVAGLKSEVGGDLQALRTQGTPQLLVDVRAELAGLRAEKRSDQVADGQRALAGGWVDGWG